MICGSWKIFSNELKTVNFCKKLGWTTFPRTRRTSKGKNIPISSLSFDLNLNIMFTKIEHRSWKILVDERALFFNIDKQRYCLIAPINLHNIEVAEKIFGFCRKHNNYLYGKQWSRIMFHEFFISKHQTIIINQLLHQHPPKYCQ